MAHTRQRMVRIVLTLFVGIMLAFGLTPWLNAAGMKRVVSQLPAKFSAQISAMRALASRKLGTTSTTSTAVKAAPFAVIAVNTLNDETTVNGQCSLREANANNDNTTQADCAAGAGADTITLNVAGTITLSAGELSATSNITINEGAGDVTISGNNVSRIFNASSTGNLALNGLTLQNGNTTTEGGGIYNDGTVTLTNCTVTGCIAVDRGGGIHNNGTLTITGSTISNNNGGDYAGGILSYVGASLTVTNSTISGNSAGAGAGIYSIETLNLTNSTISGNTATGSLTVAATAPTTENGGPDQTPCAPRQLRAAHPEDRVVIVTKHNDEALRAAAFNHCASGFIPQDNLVELLALLSAA
jgi:CSLREA domain-containing protein